MNYIFDSKTFQGPVKKGIIFTLNHQNAPSFKFAVRKLSLLKDHTKYGVLITPFTEE